MRRFSLYKRGKYFYVQFLNSETGKYMSGLSTRATTRDQAIAEPMFAPVLDTSERDTQKHTSRSFSYALYFCCSYELEDLLASLRAVQVSSSSF